MSSLNLNPNIDRPDDFYAELLAAHDGLEVEEMNAFNARLVLILANHIGETKVLQEALAAAKAK